MRGENHDQPYHLLEDSIQDDSGITIPHSKRKQHQQPARTGPSIEKLYLAGDAESSKWYLRKSPRHTPPSQVSGRNSELPPTPPSRDMDAKTPARQSSPHLIKGLWHGVASYKSGVTTPVQQRSPPTPDMTPPNSRDALSTPQPPPSRSDFSSRAESFKTAREDLHASDDGASPERPMLPIQSMQDWLDSTRIARLRRTGLVSGGGSPQNDPAPAQAVISGFQHYDGHGVGGSHNTGSTLDYDTIPNREWNTNLMSSVGMRRKQPATTIQDSAQEAAEAVHEDALPQLWRGLSLQHSVGRDVQNSCRGSVDGIKEKTVSPSSSKYSLQIHHQALDSKRLSGMSITSTIIEAVILESPVGRRRTLRHTGKNLALRSVEPGAPSCSSSDSNVRTCHPLRHKRSTLADHRARDSTGSELSAGDASGDLARTHDGTSCGIFSTAHLPAAPTSELSSSYPAGQQALIHLPQSAHDTVSIAPASRPTASRHRSTSDADPHTEVFPDRPEDWPLSLLPTGDDEDVFFTPKASAQSPVMYRDHINEVPGTASSISTDDLTKNPIARRLHQAAKEANASLNNDRRPQDTSTDLSTVVSDDELAIGRLISFNERPPRSPDRPAGRRSSHAVTRPFYSLASAISEASDIADALEVSEATAVSIYPHNNDSVLVVQQVASPNSRRQTQLEVPTTPPILTIEPSTHTIGIRTTARVESPLTNPRKPPDPPALKVVPPSPGEEMDRELVYHSSTVKQESHPPVRRISLVQRARRYSDSLLQPLFRTASARRPRPRHGRPPSLIEQGGSLHPFWRPRGFWNDFSSDEEDEPENTLPAGGDTSGVRKSGTFSAISGFLIGNSLGFERQASNRRRHYVSLPPSFRKRRERPQSAEDSTTPVGKPSITDDTDAVMPAGNRSTSSLESAGRSSFVRHHRRRKGVRLIPGLGMQVEYVGIRRLMDRIRLARMIREDRRREKKRERLRKSIGPRWVVENARVVPDL